MVRKLFLSVAILLGFATLGFGQMATLPNDPAVTVGKLDNGMTYYIRHNDQPADRAEFYLATNVGALQETPDQDGLAHFLEHMCFNGTKNFPGKGILDYLESIGASFGGNVNASTGVEQTIYLLNNIPLVRPTVVDSCLLIMHDYSHFVTCDPEEIDAERGVILEEKRSRNDASWRLREAISPALYGDTKYATTTIIGSEENLKTFKPESLTNFYKTWYRPELQALIVVGDIDVKEVEAKIKSIFSDIPASVNPQPKETIRIPDNKEPIVALYTDPELGGAANIELYWKSEPLPREMKNTVNGLAVELMQDVVSTMINERMAELSTNPNAPYLALGFGFGNLTQTCDVTNGVASAKDGKALESLAELLTEIKKVQLYGFSESELKRAQDEIISQYESAAKAADTRKNSQFVMPLIYNFFNNEPYMEPATELEIIKSILPQFPLEVYNQLAAEMVGDENMIVLYYAPEREGLSHPTKDQILEVIENVKNAEIARPAGEEIPTEFLDAKKLKGSKAGKESKGLYGAKEYKLKNGVKVILLPTEYEKNQVSFSLYKEGGLSLISQEDLYSFEDNIWSLYQANTGVAEFPRSTVTKMLAGKQLSVAPNIASYRHSIDGNTTANDLETALQLAYLYFSQPRFDADEYNLGIQQIETVLPNLINQPTFILQNEITRTVTPSPRNILLNEETLEKASLAALEKNYKKLFNDAAGATFIMVGDFDIESALPLVEKYIGSIKKGRKALKIVDHGPVYASGQIENDFRTAMQTPKVTFLQLFKVDAPFSFEAEVSSAALSYILNMVYTATLREEEGGTYGASTADAVNEAPVNARLLQTACETNDAQADALRELALKGLREIAENGPSADMYDKTVKNLEKNIPESKLRNSYWLGALRSKELYGYDRVNSYEAAVKALTPEKVQKIAAEYLAGDFIEVIMRPE